MLLRPGDFDVAVGFYERQLGLVRYREWGERPRRGVVYFLGGGYLELVVTDPDGLPVVVVETPLDHPLRRRTE